MIAWLRSLIVAWFESRRIRDLVIDPNSKCPACGACNGKLKAVMVETDEKPNKTVMVERTCNVCGAQCYEPTIVPPEKWVSADLLRGTSAPHA